MKKAYQGIFKRLQYIHLPFDTRARWSILFLVLVLFYQGQEKIYWEQDNPIQFSDFKGSPQHRAVAAVSYCGIKFSSCNKRGATSYEVFSYFEPDNSWVWSNYKYQYVIQHERLHFDIAEIYARKLRKYFSEYQVPIYYSKRVFQKFYQEYEAYQDEYDNETRHGTLDSQQKIWKEKIKQELESLSDFAEKRCY